MMMKMFVWRGRASKLIFHIFFAGDYFVYKVFKSAGVFYYKAIRKRCNYKLKNNHEISLHKIGIGINFFNQKLI